MTVDLTPEVSSRLESEKYGWLTTVAKSGQPVSRLVWFYFDGKELTVYSQPNAAKVGHIKARPRVSLNLDSDGHGGGVIVVGGEARVDATDINPLEDQQQRAKYGEYAAGLGMSEEFLASYSTRLRIGIDKLWTTPTAG
jgi:PPOX class probable F420-dependent enzyme